MHKVESSYIEISKSALKNNYDFLRNYLNKNVRISSVVKGNAYGHGIESFVPLAESLGVNHFSVFSCDEAIRVKSVCKKRTSIMIMGFIASNQLAWAIKNEIEICVFDLFRLHEILKTSKRLKKKAKLHIEVETGMNRTGFRSKDLKIALEIIHSNKKYFSVIGVCTHYAGAESIANYYRVTKQYQLFNTIYKKYFKDEFPNIIRHTACSAAALRYPKTQMDMVRLGIVQYGFFPNNEVAIDYLTKNKTKQSPLKRLISWKSKVMVTHKVKTGEYIGYGTSFLADSNKKIAVVPIGYSNGYTRALSNQGRMLVNGKLASVIGIINMNMATLDISHIENVKEESEVVLIGKQGDNEISVSSFSEFTDLVNYELLTRLPVEIPRIIVK